MVKAITRIFVPLRMFIAAYEYVAAGWLFADLRPAKSLEVKLGRCLEVDACRWLMVVACSLSRGWRLIVVGSGPVSGDVSADVI